MKKSKIINITTGEILVENCSIADSFFTRFKGLMGKKALNNNEGLCIIPCKSVHTFFMRFCIDVIFIGEDDTIIDIIEGIRPWRVSPYIKKAKYVLELPQKPPSIKNKKSEKNRKKLMEIGHQIKIMS